MNEMENVFWASLQTNEGCSLQATYEPFFMTVGQAWRKEHCSRLTKALAYSLELLELVCRCFVKRGKVQR